tara:strand:- start:448 stop:972 length:525 start_codon:yes stop_codon:yes gene_type:complete
MIKRIRNVILKEDLFSLYKELINSTIFALNNKSNANTMAGTFPAVCLIKDGQPQANFPYWIGYTNCLFDMINTRCQEQHGFSLRKNIKRTIINAQNNNHYASFHIDGDSSEQSIVGFLTPQWAEDWGGELNIEGEICRYEPGDFILFDSSQLHKNQEIKNIPYWRISLAYVIEK